MKIILLLSLLISSHAALAYTCQCVIEVYPPVTASHAIPLESKIYDEGREFGKLSKVTYQACLMDCRESAHNDYSYPQLQQIVQKQTVKLIEKAKIGHNCTGQTTLKYPVRFKANLGPIALGNIREEMVIIQHEEQCF